MVPVLVDIMDVDTDTPVVAAANPRAHVRRVTADTDHCDRRRLRNEDEVALGVRRHRVRAGRLRDGLDQHAGRRRSRRARPPVAPRSDRGARYFAIPVGGRVVAPVALVEPDLIRADDAADVGKVLGLRVDDQRGRVARVVGRRAAEQQIVMRSDRGAVRSARVERDDPGVRGRIEGAEHCRSAVRDERRRDRSPAARRRR